MTTKTMTAAEAQAFATQLATEEKDLAERKAAARSSAAFEAHEVSLADQTSALNEAATNALDAWGAAVADPAVSIDGLFLAWVTMRATSAVRADHVAHANRAMGELKPRILSGTSHQIEYRSDTNDSRVRDQWQPALEGAIQARVVAAVNAHRNAQQAAVVTAAENAAAAIN